MNRDAQLALVEKFAKMAYGYLVDNGHRLDKANDLTVLMNVMHGLLGEYRPPPAKEHDWKLYEYDGGAAGCFDARECHVCGANGGSDIVTMAPFYADGSGLKLTDDCDESKRLIAAYKLGQERAYLRGKKK